MKVNALVIPLICEPICGQPINCAEKAFEHLPGLDLADSFHSGATLEVNILIGSDYYCRFTTGRVLHGRTGPIANFMPSSIGYCLAHCQEWPKRRCSQFHASIYVLQADGEVVQGNPYQSLDSQLKKFWDLKSLRILSTELPLYYIICQWDYLQEPPL